jgi:hypothetical protein
VDFCVIYIEGTGRTGSIVVSWPEYDIPGISREARRQRPGIDVRCVIPRTPSPLIR